MKKLEQDRPLSDYINTLTRVVEDGKILEASERLSEDSTEHGNCAPACAISHRQNGLNRLL